MGGNEIGLWVIFTEACKCHNTIIWEVYGCYCFLHRWPSAAFADHVHPAAPRGHHPPGNYHHPDLINQTPCIRMLIISDSVSITGCPIRERLHPAYTLHGDCLHQW